MGCIYNLGCCFYLTSQFANAEKWFSLGVKLDLGNIDCYIGKAMSCLKLGEYQIALETISEVTCDETWGSKLYQYE